MVALFLAVALAQGPACSPDALALIKAANDRAAAFDLSGAAQRLQSAVISGCADAEVPWLYLRGWIAAREAYRHGGSPESLRPVLQAIAKLQAIGASGPAQMASLVLQAAAAAAQSERDELALMIDYAVLLEGRNLSARLPGLPILTAHEAAGELWLQVYRYDEALRAYKRAAEQIGVTPRVTLGLARTAVRLEAQATACTQYRAFVAAWKGTGAEPSELSEARTFLTNAECQQRAVTPRP